MDKQLEPITPKGQSLRKLENAVALGIKDENVSDLPKLERGVTFYQSIICELK